MIRYLFVNYTITKPNEQTETERYKKNIVMLIKVQVIYLLVFLRQRKILIQWCKQNLIMEWKEPIGDYTFVC